MKMNKDFKVRRAAEEKPLDVKPIVQITKDFNVEVTFKIDGINPRTCTLTMTLQEVASFALELRNVKADVEIALWRATEQKTRTTCRGDKPWPCDYCGYGPCPLP